MNVMHRLLVVLFLGSTLVRMVEGQTLFTIPDTLPNYQAYRHLDECISTIHRTEAFYGERKVSPMRDTNIFVREDVGRTLPPQVSSVGGECIQMIDLDIDTLPREFVHYWARSLLKVNRDIDVNKLYAKVIDSIPRYDRYQTYRRMLGVYRDARPIRINVIDSVYKIALESIPPDSAVWVLSLNDFMVDVSLDVDDTAAALAYHTENLRIIDTIPSETKNSLGYHQTAILIFMKSVLFADEEGLDSLRVSTESYRFFLRRIWEHLLVDHFEERRVAGAAIPQVNGDYWFRANLNTPDTNTLLSIRGYSIMDSLAVPVEGKVNLIAFFQGGCHLSTPLIEGRLIRSNGKYTCIPSLSAIRRIVEMYPQVQVTVVTRTFGMLGSVALPDSKKEAELLAEYFINYHQIPGYVAVEETPYFRLPGSDHRRIDTETPNDVNFQINGRPLGYHGSVLLVDEAGKIFHADELGSISGEGEARVKRKIGAVLSRLKEQ